jgi:hypothetical protein
MDFVTFHGKSRQYVLDRMDQDGLLLRYVPTLDIEIVRRAVRQNGMALQYAKTFNGHLDIGMEAVRQKGRALEFCSPDLKRRKDIVMEAVQQDGLALSFADTSLQANRDVVLAAVHENGEALHYASPKLKADKEVIMTAMSNTPFAIENIPRMTKPLVIELVQMNGNILSFLDRAFQADRDIVLAAVNQIGKALRYASRDLQADPLVLSYAKYSDQPIELTPEQNEQVESFLQESRATYESFKKWSKGHTRSIGNTRPRYSPHPMMNLSNHGPNFHNIFLQKLYGFSGLDEDIVFILNKSKVPDIGGNRKRKTRRMRRG